MCSRILDSALEGRRGAFLATLVGLGVVLRAGCGVVLRAGFGVALRISFGGDPRTCRAVGLSFRVGFVFGLRKSARKVFFPCCRPKATFFVLAASCLLAVYDNQGKVT